MDAAGYFPPLTLRGTGPAEVFFSASATSPSLGFLPATPSGANVYFDPNTTAGGNEQLYVSPNQLGLQPGDDLDAMIILDDGNNVFNQGVDAVLFSLRRNSPTLQDNPVLSAADVFLSTGLFSFQVLAGHQDLGLLPVDELDALELLPCTDIMVCIAERGILPEPATAVLLLAGAWAATRRRPSRR
jgi:hypothetical protein